MSEQAFNNTYRIVRDELDRMHEVFVKQDKRVKELEAENALRFDALQAMKAQLEAVKPLYIAINEMMAVLGAEGEINTRHEKTEAVMNALYELDDGVYDVDKFMQSLEKNHG